MLNRQYVSLNTPEERQQFRAELEKLTPGMLADKLEDQNIDSLKRLLDSYTNWMGSNVTIPPAHLERFRGIVNKIESEIGFKKIEDIMPPNQGMAAKFDRYDFENYIRLSFPASPKHLRLALTEALAPYKTQKPIVHAEDSSLINIYLDTDKIRGHEEEIAKLIQEKLAPPALTSKNQTTLDIFQSLQNNNMLDDELSPEELEMNMHEAAEAYQKGKKLEDAGKIKEAIAQYEDAAMLDHPEAKADLARHLRKGTGGIAIEYERAFKLLTEAANAGIARAQYDMALMYARGTKPLEEINLLQAKKWLEKAAQNGEQQAITALRDNPIFNGSRSLSSSTAPPSNAQVTKNETIHVISNPEICLAETKNLIKKIGDQLPENKGSILRKTNWKEKWNKLNANGTMANQGEMDKPDYVPNSKENALIYLFFQLKKLESYLTGHSEKTPCEISKTTQYTDKVTIAANLLVTRSKDKGSKSEVSKVISTILKDDFPALEEKIKGKANAPSATQPFRR